MDAHKIQYGEKDISKVELKLRGRFLVNNKNSTFFKNELVLKNVKWIFLVKYNKYTRKHNPKVVLSKSEIA